jgi:hypothetical protein
MDFQDRYTVESPLQDLSKHIGNISVSSLSVDETVTNWDVFQIVCLDSVEGRSSQCLVFDSG